MANPKHLRTFGTTKEFTEAYNSGSFAVPYVAVILDILDSKNKPLVIFSNRLPYKQGEIPAPVRLSHNITLGEAVIGASRL